MIILKKCYFLVLLNRQVINLKLELLTQFAVSINHLTAGAAYTRVFIFIKYHLVNMLKIKCDINQQYLLTAILSKLNNFHSLEVVDRVSETQL